MAKSKNKKMRKVLPHRFIASVGAKVVLLRAAALATMTLGWWTAETIGAPFGAGGVFAAVAAIASLDLLLRRRMAPEARPARARAADHGRRGGARPRGQN